MSSASAVVSTSNRWLTTIWKASPALISSTAAATAPWNSSGVRCRRIGSVCRRTAAETTADGVGSASSAVIASTRATASAYASSTRSSVSSKLIALAISQTSLVWWSSTPGRRPAGSRARGCRSSGLLSGSRSSRRTVS